MIFSQTHLKGMNLAAQNAHHQRSSDLQVSVKQWKVQGTAAQVALFSPQPLQAVSWMAVPPALPVLQTKMSLRRLFNGSARGLQVYLFQLKDAL